MSGRVVEFTVEEAVLSWLQGLGYAILHGPDIAPGELFSERTSYEDVVLEERLREALARINPHLPSGAIDDAARKVLRTESPSLAVNNRRFHSLLVDGVDVAYQSEEGRTVHDIARLVDCDELENNDWLAVNQFTVVEGPHTRRPDIVLFLNGLPLVVMELKNPADEDATIRGAYNQLQTYRQEIPSLFTFNEVLVISDGLEARFGSITSPREWFLPWRTITGEEEIPLPSLELDVLVKGMFERQRLLDYMRGFVVFEDEKAGPQKKLAGYHQFHAVRHAVEATVEATQAERDNRCGVVWHTQGSGKSLTMVFFAGRVVQHPALENPTLVVLTDRNDLDDQLHRTFAGCRELLRQTPERAKSRAHLRQLLKKASGGIVFTTLQKFLPEEKGDQMPALSDRRNVIVIADEAHRSQYDFIDGYARHMRDALPNASFIAFTATPLERADRNTRAVFGDYTSIYDMHRAVEDEATVPIYYESRLARLALDENEKPTVDEEFEEVTEGEELEQREKLKAKWAALEKLVGTENRLGLIAKDLVDHFEQRLEVMGGKAMVVCMSRRICVDLYDHIVGLRPQWHDADNKKGEIKVVMTGSAADGKDWQQHIRNKDRREDLAERFKDPNDRFKLVIVRDMWLTGFNVPCLHTMYVDKPMRGHTLMQAIARVNRVFPGKEGGLVVDYIGLGYHLKRALADYTDSGGKGRTAIDQEEAVAVMLEKHEICCDMFHGFDWSAWRSKKPAERLDVLPAAQQHVLAQEKGKERLLKAVNELSRAFALSVPHEKAIGIRDEVRFFQAVRAALVKSTRTDGKTMEEIEYVISQLVSRAVVADEVLDIFAAVGLEKPDVSILSDEFLAEVREMPQRNLAVEALARLLEDEIKARRKKNLVQSKTFSEKLEESIKKYQSRALDTAQILEELIQLAKEMREADRRGEDLGLSEDELAFYDALETNDSAVAVLGEPVLKTIALELVQAVQQNTPIDWSVKESARARLRVMIKRILRKYGYPPDKQEKATQTVLEQAELISVELVS